MSFAPRSLLELEAYWRAHGGASAGIVGSSTHRYGYHLGKDRIFSATGQGWNDYSVKTAADRAGLSNAAAAFDIGRLNGSLPQLRTFSKWLVGRARANAPGTAQIREIIYSPDGKVILRWDRQRGYASAPRAEPGLALSHLTHSHLSFYRNTEAKEKRPIFAPYFEPTPPAPPEDPPMPTISTYIPGQEATIGDPTGPAYVRAEPKVGAAILRTIVKGSTETWTVIGWVKGELVGASDQWLWRWAAGVWEYTAKVNVQKVGPPPDPTPYGPVELADASRKGYNDGLAAATSAVQALPRK